MLTLGQWKCRLKDLELSPVRHIHRKRIADIKAQINRMEAVIFHPAERRHSHYGIHIKIFEMGKLRYLTNEVKADHKADVHVEIGGQVREFTFDEFLGLLGFKE